MNVTRPITGALNSHSFLCVALSYTTRYFWTESISSSSLKAISRCQCFVYFIKLQLYWSNLEVFHCTPKLLCNIFLPFTYVPLMPSSLQTNFFTCNESEHKGSCNSLYKWSHLHIFVAQTWKNEWTIALM